MYTLTQNVVRRPIVSYFVRAKNKQTNRRREITVANIRESRSVKNRIVYVKSLVRRQHTCAYTRIYVCVCVRVCVNVRRYEHHVVIRVHNYNKLEINRDVKLLYGLREIYYNRRYMYIFVYIV